jgi:hypothetical protein
MKTLPFKLLAVLLVVLIASSSFLDDARGAGTVAVLDGGISALVHLPRQPR